MHDPFLNALTIRAAEQVRVADRVITLTDTGNIRKRDSLLVPPKPMSNARKSEFVDEIDNAFSGSRPLSIIEIVQSTYMKTLPQVSFPPDKTSGKTVNPAVYRYYVGFGGRRRFLLFLLLCAIFVSAMTFSR